MKRVVAAAVQASVLISLCFFLAWQYYSHGSLSNTIEDATKYLPLTGNVPLPTEKPAATVTIVPPAPQVTESRADGEQSSKTQAFAETTTSGTDALSTVLPTSESSSEPPAPAATLTPERLPNASVYVQSIMHPEDSVFPRLECPVPIHGRYEYLKPKTLSPNSPPPKPRYFFALDLYQCASILPRLLGSIIETINFLGPENCVLSIVEGRSTDGTFDILEALKDPLASEGIAYHFTNNNVDPKAGEGVDRIQALADLRNQALLPLTKNPQHYDPDTTVLFINDVALCMEDILELIHQREFQSADMTCAMDWIFGGWSFYDVWISRGMNGDQFFEIPQSGAWDFAQNLFWNDPTSRKRLDAIRPFQVFACWNGATAFTAKPLLDGTIKFRTNHDGECYLGEPTHFCKDMWWEGYNKIAVVPSINIGYDDEESRKIKASHGNVSRWVQDESSKEAEVPMKIDWSTTPPEKIKCVPTYQNPTWVRWDQGVNITTTTELMERTT